MATPKNDAAAPHTPPTHLISRVALDQSSGLLGGVRSLSADWGNAWLRACDLIRPWGSSTSWKLGKSQKGPCACDVPDAAWRALQTQNRGQNSDPPLTVAASSAFANSCARGQLHPDCSPPLRLFAVFISISPFFPGPQTHPPFAGPLSLSTGRISRSSRDHSAQ